MYTYTYIYIHVVASDLTICMYDKLLIDKLSLAEKWLNKIFGVSRTRIYI